MDIVVMIAAPLLGIWVYYFIRSKQKKNPPPPKVPDPVPIVLKEINPFARIPKEYLDLCEKLMRKDLKLYPELKENNSFISMYASLFNSVYKNLPPYTSIAKHPGFNVLPEGYGTYLSYFRDLLPDPDRDFLLQDFFRTQFAFKLPDEILYRHTWILGLPGTGKTQLIQAQVLSLIPRVEKNKGSIVVMDGHRDLIETISNLQIFAPGEPLHDKLVVLEPNLNFPLALNIFSLGAKANEIQDEDDREEYTTNAVASIIHILDAIMGEAGAMTPKQTALFRHIVRLLMEVPDGTLDTFQALLNIGHLEKTKLDAYKPYINKLHKAAQDFFDHQFFDKDYNDTKAQVAWRLASLRENKYFDRMFSSPTSKLDMYEELNESKVFLIDTSKKKLGEDEANILGRYFISALLTASQRRVALKRSQRKPVFLFIDEVHDYIAYDAKIATMLDQCRKMSIAVTLAHQRTSQIKDSNVLDALTGTAVQFAKTDVPRDVALLKKLMKFEDFDYISKQYLAVHIQGIDTFLIKVPWFLMENMPKMSKDARAEITENMRARYGYQFAPLVEPRPEEKRKLSKIQTIRVSFLSGRGWRV